MKIVRKITAMFLCAAILFGGAFIFVGAAPAVQGGGELKLDCRSAILMEASTGEVLYEMNADEALPPASVTKVMTLLLVMEAIEDGRLSLEDTVTASEHACSRGGSQIYLEPGEQMSVEDLLKSVVIASANDAALALAEHIAGSEESFVAMMNKRAAELGMTNTRFENTNGLDDTVTEHVTSARDIAIMSRELIKHEKITEYSSIWMDTIRGGEFGLTNTNRLVRFYKGATGLKTGSTSKAKFCITATAKQSAHLVTYFIGGLGLGFFAHFHNFSCHFKSHPFRATGRGRIISFSLHQIRAVEGGGFNFYQYFFAFDDRIGHIVPAKRFISIYKNRFHVYSPLVDIF